MEETENECSIRISRRLIYFGNGLNPFVCSLVFGEKAPVAQTQLLRHPFMVPVADVLSEDKVGLEQCHS